MHFEYKYFAESGQDLLGEGGGEQLNDLLWLEGQHRILLIQPENMRVELSESIVEQWEKRLQVVDKRARASGHMLNRPLDLVCALLRLLKRLPKRCKPLRGRRETQVYVA